jgi:hypothetical protein
MIAGAQMVTRTGLEAASFQAVTAPDEASRSPERGSRQPLDAHPRLRARPTRPHAPAESPRLPRTSKRSADSPPRRQPRATSRSRTRCWRRQVASLGPFRRMNRRGRPGRRSQRPHAPRAEAINTGLAW